MTAGKLILLHKKHHQECSKLTQTRTIPQHSSFTTKTPARLNNIGVGLLMSGRNEDALKVFTKSLKITKAFLARISKTSSASQCTPPSSPIRRAVSPCEEEKENSLPHRCPGAISINGDDDSVQASTFSLPASTKLHSIKQGRHSHNSNNTPGRLSVPLRASSNMFLFTEPITADEEECLYTQGRACLMKLSASIIFNMALANHKKGLSRMKAMRANTERDVSVHNKYNQRAMVADLKKALALYELSCRMQSREHVNLDRVCVLGHMNNMGHIHATLGNTPMANRCFQRLLKSLMLHKGKAGEEGDHDSCLVGFRQNSAHLLVRGKILSPVAA